MRVVLLALACFGLIGAGAAGEEPVDLDAAAPPADGPIIGHAYWENDSPYFKFQHGIDRWYTNGVGISVMWHPRFAADFAPWLPFAEQFGDPDRVAFGVTVGQLMFTPDDILDPAFIPDDHPYAGYLYGAAIVQRIRGNTYDHFQIEFGQTGVNSLAEDAQKWVHDLMGDDEPQGWSHQIPDEFQFQLYVRKRWRVDLIEQWWPGHAGGAFGFEALPEVAGALGTMYRNLEGGLILRAGWHLPDDFGPSRLQSITPPPGEQRAGWSVYGFGRASGKLVEGNLPVEGAYSRGGPGLDAERLVGEFQLGVNLAYTDRDWAVQLGYSQTFQSPEFEGQPVWQGIGAWTLSVQHWF